MTAVKPPSLKQLSNEKALKVYAAVLCFLIVMVAAARWLRVLCNRRLRPWPTRGGARYRAILLAFRHLEKRPRWKWLCGLPVGLLLLLGVLFVINATLSVTFIVGLRINYFASRFGWLAVANMVLCVLLGLRNTPLSSMALVSHATINTAHRIMGYSAAFLVAIHGLLYTVYFVRQGTWERLFEHGNIQGFSAGAGMLFLLCGYMRHQNYELFYASHLCGFVATVFFTGIHRPDWAKKLPLVMVIVACMWAVERFLRAVRLAYHLVGAGLCQQAVALYPLTDGGTRLLLRSRRAHAAPPPPPGSHCYLWIPCVGLSQSHPFTVVSSGPWGLELVIKAHNGFTRRLSELAAGRPGSVSWASVDGPYGSLPDLQSHEKLILIGGGSGAAYTFGLMNHLLASHVKTRPKSVDFVWAVKHSGQLSWFRQHLSRLKRVPEGMSVNVSIYITSEKKAHERHVDVVDTLDEPGADELSGILSSGECQQSAAEQTSGLYSCTYKLGSMSTDDVLWDAMQSVASLERSLVVTCGPLTLMTAARHSVESYRENHRQQIVNFYSEEFN